MIKVRYARLEDTAGICRAHRSQVKDWTRTLGDIEYPVRYGSLSIGERWGFGGPWMSPETCAIRLNEMFFKGHMTYVAEKKGVIVGHMELFIGREGATFGKNAHIPVLYVHEKHSGKGVGAALVAKAFQEAKSMDCDTLTAASSPDNFDFYIKQGIDVRQEYVEACIPAGERKIEWDTGTFNPYLEAHGCDMTIGRYQSATCHLFEASVRYAVEDHTGSGRQYCRLNVESHPSLFLLDKDERNRVYGWTKGASAAGMVEAGLCLASSKDMKYADMLLSSKDYEAIKEKYDTRVEATWTMLVHDFRSRR